MEGGQEQDHVLLEAVVELAFPWHFLSLVGFQNHLVDDHTLEPLEWLPVGKAAMLAHNWEPREMLVFLWPYRNSRIKVGAPHGQYEKPVPLQLRLVYQLIEKEALTLVRKVQIRQRWICLLTKSDLRCLQRQEMMLVPKVHYAHTRVSFQLAVEVAVVLCVWPLPVPHYKSCWETFRIYILSFDHLSMIPL